MDAVLAARFDISDNNLMIKTSMFALGGNRQISISLVRDWPNSLSLRGMLMSTNDKVVVL